MSQVLPLSHGIEAARAIAAGVPFVDVAVAAARRARHRPGLRRASAWRCCCSSSARAASTPRSSWPERAVPPPGWSGAPSGPGLGSWDEQRTGHDVSDEPTGPVPVVRPAWRPQRDGPRRRARAGGAPGGRRRRCCWLARSPGPGHRRARSRPGRRRSRCCPGPPSRTAPPAAGGDRRRASASTSPTRSAAARCPTGAAFGIVGVNGGAPRTSNKCLAEQVAWAQRLGALRRLREHVVLRTRRPGGVRPRPHRRRDRRASRRSCAAAPRCGGSTSRSPTPGAARSRRTRPCSRRWRTRLQELGVRVGIYSSPQQCADHRRRLGAGPAGVERDRPGDAEVGDSRPARSRSPARRPPIVQWVQRADGRRLDHNVICPAWSDRAGDLLDLSAR